MGEKYSVQQTDVGYIIYQQGRNLPLPFNWISKQYADEACYQFNKGGYRAVAEYYYVHKVAGTRDISRMIEKGINPYEEWMGKNGDMFKPREYFG